MEPFIYEKDFTRAPQPQPEQKKTFSLRKLLIDNGFSEKPYMKPRVTPYVADLGTNCTGICENGCTVTWKPSCRTGISKENLLRLKAAHPEIYREYVTTTVSRRFSVRQSKPEAA